MRFIKSFIVQKRAFSPNDPPLPPDNKLKPSLTCGYGGANANEDCYNCPTGYQIAVIFTDCTGFCILPADEADFTAAGYPPMDTSDCQAIGSEYPLPCAAADCSSGCVGETTSSCDDDDDDDVGTSLYRLHTS